MQQLFWFQFAEHRLTRRSCSKLRQDLRNNLHIYQRGLCSKLLGSNKDRLLHLQLWHALQLLFLLKALADQRASMHQL